MLPSQNNCEFDVFLISVSNFEKDCSEYVSSICDSCGRLIRLLLTEDPGVKYNVNFLTFSMRVDIHFRAVSVQPPPEQSIPTQ